MRRLCHNNDETGRGIARRPVILRHSQTLSFDAFCPVVIQVTLGPVVIQATLGPVVIQATICHVVFQATLCRSPSK